MGVAVGTASFVGEGVIVGDVVGLGVSVFGGGVISGTSSSLR